MSLKICELSDFKKRHIIKQFDQSKISYNLTKFGQSAAVSTFCGVDVSRDRIGLLRERTGLGTTFIR